MWIVCRGEHRYLIVGNGCGWILIVKGVHKFSRCAQRWHGIGQVELIIHKDDGSRHTRKINGARSSLKISDAIVVQEGRAGARKELVGVLTSKLIDLYWLCLAAIY